MRFGVMITQGPGGHPSWKHAEVTADKLVLDPELGVPDYAAKYEAAAQLRRRLRDELEKHHEDVKKHELGQLQQDGHTRLAAPLEPEGKHLDDAINTVHTLVKGTILEHHFMRPEVVEAMRDVLKCEFRTQQHIHRSEHAQKKGN